MQMSTTSRPRIKSQSVVTKCQVEIVDLKGSYLRSAGTKSAAILDGTKLCRVEEFAARHFRRSGFEATFLESAPFHVLFSVYFWSVIQDRWTVESELSVFWIARPTISTDPAR
jgi:hypothetical protein